jgi:hypothetical protein
MSRPVTKSPVDAAQGCRPEVRARQQIDAQDLHHVELASGPIEGARPVGSGRLLKSLNGWNSEISNP